MIGYKYYYYFKDSYVYKSCLETPEKIIEIMEAKHGKLIGVGEDGRKYYNRNT